MGSDSSAMADMNALVRQILDMLAQVFATNAAQFPAERALGRELLTVYPMVSPTGPASVRDKPATEASGPTTLRGEMPALPKRHYPDRELGVAIEPVTRLQPPNGSEQTRSEHHRHSTRYQIAVDPRLNYVEPQMTPSNGIRSRKIQTASGTSLPHGGIVPIQAGVGPRSDVRSRANASPTQDTSRSKDEHGASELRTTPQTNLPGSTKFPMTRDRAVDSITAQDTLAAPSARDDVAFIPRPYDNDRGLNAADGYTEVDSPAAQHASMNSAVVMDFLDEARLGRWVLDQLAKEASRPNAGMTGADPRVTPTYPGASFGA